MKVADLFALLRIKPDKASFASSERFLASVKKGLTAVAVLGGVAAAAMGKMISDTATVADQYAKMSKQVGISVEGLQQLEFAAGISGTGLASLRTGLQRFARTADDAAQGLKTAQEPFVRLGIAFKDGAGGLRPLEDMLGDVAEAFSKMEDGPVKTALAMKTFGRAGAQLIPLLNEGRDGVNKLKEEFTSLGGEISGEQAKAFEEYNDTIFRIKTTLIGFRNQAVIALLPMLKKITKGMFTWIKANKELLKAKLLKFMKGLLKATVFLFKAIGFLIDNAGKMVRVFLIWKAITIALAAAQAIMAAGSIVAAIKVGAAWLAATLPIVLMTVLIIALALIIEDFIGFLTGKDSLIGAVFGDAIEEWQNAFVEFFEWLEEKFRQFNDSDEINLLNRILGRETRADRIGKKTVQGVEEFTTQGNIRTAASRRREAAADLRFEALQQSAFPTVQRPGAEGATLDSGVLTGAPVAGATNNFVFNGMGVDEVARVVGDVVRENDEANANAIGVDTP